VACINLSPSNFAGTATHTNRSGKPYPSDLGILSAGSVRIEPKGFGAKEGGGGRGK